ncbi:MAG: DinB family protein [Anaerolineae bacterium]|nr:DinB family protein [Phycisphaerae bacterium]
MSDLFRTSVLITWRRDIAYALRLVGDLSDDQMIAQPVPGRAMNHPAWTLAHLTLYNEVIAKMLNRVPFDDPKEHPFGMKSSPQGDARIYGPRAGLIDAYKRSHDEAERALVECDQAVFAEDVPLERWRAAHPKVADMTVMLIAKHESMHLGQLSAWRRAMGLGRVEM